MENIKIHFIVDMPESQAHFCPPLGVGYLSSYVKRQLPNSKISLSYLSDNIVSEIARSKPDILAITSTSRYFMTMCNLAAHLKVKFKLPIVWGGVHISIAPHELPKCAEVGVLGEGEETLTELLRSFNGSGFSELNTIKGIVYWDNGVIVKTEKRSFIDPLDNLPYPDVALFRVPWGRACRAVMMTSRGCPFKCRFCASSVFWDRTRLHSAEYVVNEMRHLVLIHDVKEILIYDDFFTINSKRISHIAKLIKSDPTFRYLKIECLSRVDNFTESLAEQMKDMGVKRISFGMESGCQKTLDYLKNNTIRLEQTRQAVAIARAHKLECVGSFVIGSPFETAENIDETLRFIASLHLDSVQITIATPFPGTELWEDGKRLGKIESDSWSDDYYVLFAWAEHFSTFERDLHSKVAILLHGKALMTQIEPDIFTDLIVKAIRLQLWTNFRFRRVLFERLLRVVPPSIIKIGRRLIRHESV